jgi:hypothetical protein
VLGLINHLELRDDTSQARLLVLVKPYPAKPSALVVESREKGTGKTLRFPAFLLPDEGIGGESTTVILPAGVAGRSMSIRFYDKDGRESLDWQLGDLIERNADSELWSLSV